MTTRLEQRGFLSGRPGRQMVVAALVTAVLVVAASVYVWIDLGGGAIYGDARIKEAEFHPPDRLRLILDSCYAFIRNSRFESTPVRITVSVEAFTTFPRRSGCQEYVETQLGGPLYDRKVIDGRTGQPVSVRTVE